MLRPVPDAARLFIESSTPRASLALLLGSMVVWEESFTGDRSHNALLFAPLERALACLKDGEKLVEVVIGTGPGSYSGTRVGIAAGQGVAMVHGCPAVGLCSLLAVPAAESGRSLAIGDARRGSAWSAVIEDGLLVREPELCAPAELEDAIRTAGEAAVFSLEAVGKVGLSEEALGRVLLERPDALRLATAWLRLPQGEKDRLAELPPQPMYLRPPHITAAKGGHPLLRR
jgi:tRNA threonylcarbamoyl adenosine modification protein YeaZ